VVQSLWGGNHLYFSAMEFMRQHFLYVFMTEEQLDDGMNFSPDKIEVKECKTIIQSPVALCKIYTFGDASNGIKIKMNLAHFPSDDKSWIVVGWEAFP